MTLDPKRVLDEALSLPVGERADLAARLIESLDEASDDDAESSWSVEIERRVRELDSGLAKTLSWPELRARLMGRLNDSSAA